jgi:hypothetical protein
VGAGGISPSAWGLRFLAPGSWLLAPSS